MSDETASSPENTPTPEAESAPRARRISNPRPKKAAKKAASAKVAAPAPVAVEVASIPFPSTPRRDERPEAPSQGGNDWAEPEGESSGGAASQSESSKRKRRRRKGKGQGNAPQNHTGEPSGEATSAVVAAETKSPEADPRPRPQQPPQPRAKIDPELLTKMAWKIYLAEVSEEGVALIGDNDAKDLSRRCFRLAEIFIEEQARRR